MRLSLLTCASLHSEYGGCGKLTHTRCSLQTDPQATRSLVHDRLHLTTSSTLSACQASAFVVLPRLDALLVQKLAVCCPSGFAAAGNKSLGDSAMDKSYEERSSLKKQHATKEALRLCAMISLPKREISFALRFLECVTAD